jgi:hypothetical protein
VFHLALEAGEVYKGVDRRDHELAELRVYLALFEPRVKKLELPADVGDVVAMPGVAQG